jgi:TRAP-type C4-dicarboxylate transport system permease small subunit
LKKLNHSLQLIEDSLLIVLLISMVLLANGQIVLRNFFDLGITWVDPLLRVLVLWSGLIGATVASRDNKHIRIDLISHFFKKRIHLVLQAFVGLFTAFICSLIAWHGARWVHMDYQDHLSAFAGLPAWLLEVIIPLAFGLIAVRYLTNGSAWLWQAIRYRQSANIDSRSRQ